MENTLELKKIGDLLKYEFLVPSYQRGYRWSIEQVDALLEDIWGYKVDSSNEQAFYCLQPVVVKENEGKQFELIDGQQRLTTILLMLHYFNEHHFKLPKAYYSLNFTTRILQQNFLERITDNEFCEKNIDLFHLHQAYTYIQSWFEKRETINPSIQGDFYSKLVNNVSVIWYMVNDDSSVIDIFTRLNIGKILLTNAELIKALFLSRSVKNQDENKDLKQINIATEWDRMEQTLQTPEFWYFISNKPQKYETRIEFIFDLMTGKHEEDSDNFTFNKFYKEFESGKSINEVWLEVKQNFLMFEDWFLENDFYHLIGFLVATGKPIAEIKKISRGKSKTVFKSDLVLTARKAIRTPLEELNFHKDKTEVRFALLLFNVLTIISNKKSSLRFPFNHFYNQKWDIEHIRSQTGKDIKGKDRLEWAKVILEYFTGLENDCAEDNLKTEIAKIEKPIILDFCQRLLIVKNDEDRDGAIFSKLHDELKLYFNEKDSLQEPDGLGNLTLLDEGTNRMYKNAFFPIKRKHILNIEKRGIFVPLCTKNIFLKVYTKKLDEVMHWQANDADGYLNEIIKTLK